jgi:pimeloyl-ACP methyl ester carboxylesterase
MQRKLGRLAARRDWGRVLMTILSEVVLPRGRVGRIVTAPVAAGFWVLGRVTLRDADPADMVITIDAEDAFDVTDRLSEIRVPVLVVGGARDPFYSPELFEATANGIPGGRLHLEPGGGHVPTAPAVQAAIRGFLLDDPAAAGA